METGKRSGIVCSNQIIYSLFFDVIFVGRFDYEMGLHTPAKKKTKLSNCMIQFWSMIMIQMVHLDHDRELDAFMYMILMLLYTFYAFKNYASSYIMNRFF